jgi:Protein of unknown function (DUF3105)
VSKRAREQSRVQRRLAEVQRQQRAKQRRQRMIWSGVGVAVAAVVAVIVVVTLPSSSGSTTNEVIPPGVGGGTPDVQHAALVVPNTTGITGVVAYDTTGWPTTSHNGLAAQALPHNHVPGPVTYSVTPPVGGDHNGTWMNCGVYAQPVPTERAVHNLEHGAIWITYQPSMPRAEVNQLRSFESSQSVVAGGSRYIDVTPFPGLPTPIVASSWGFQLRLTSPTDARLQQFVNKFRVSQQYTPEYGAPCTGGVGTPLQK